MSEWHVTPDYIINNWTDELFNLMIEKLSERKHRELVAISSGDSGGYKVSDKTLFARARNMIKVVKN